MQLNLNASLGICLSVFDVETGKELTEEQLKEVHKKLESGELLLSLFSNRITDGSGLDELYQVDTDVFQADYDFEL